MFGFCECRNFKTEAITENTNWSTQIYKKDTSYEILFKTKDRQVSQTTQGQSRYIT